MLSWLIEKIEHMKARSILRAIQNNLKSRSLVVATLGEGGWPNIYSYDAMSFLFKELDRCKIPHIFICEDDTPSIIFASNNPAETYDAYSKTILNEALNDSQEELDDARNIVDLIRMKFEYDYNIVLPEVPVGSWKSKKESSRGSLE